MTVSVLIGQVSITPFDATDVCQCSPRDTGLALNQGVTERASDSDTCDCLTRKCQIPHPLEVDAS